MRIAGYFFRIQTTIYVRGIVVGRQSDFHSNNKASLDFPPFLMSLLMRYDCSRDVQNWILAHYRRIGTEHLSVFREVKECIIDVLDMKRSDTFASLRMR